MAGRGGPMNRGIKQSVTWIENRNRSIRATWARKRASIRGDLSRLERRLRHHMMPALSGCWLWTGSKFPNGYGCFSDRRFDRHRSVGAHRIAWEVWRGKIPQGLFVCHSCDIKACINPDHLFLGTASDNTQDGWRKGRLTGLHLRNPVVKEKALSTIRQMYRDGILVTIHDSSGRLVGRKRAIT